MTKLLRLAFIALWAVTIVGCTSPNNSTEVPDNVAPAPEEDPDGAEAMSVDVDDDMPGEPGDGGEG